MALPARVAVTGAGIVTAHGIGWKANAEGFRLGRPAFRPVTLFDVSRQRVKLAAEVDLPAGLPFSEFNDRQRSRMDRASQLLLWAAHEAHTQSGWGGDDTLPIVLGTTSGGMSLGEDYYRHAVEAPLRQSRQPGRVLNYLAQQQGIDLAVALGTNGPVTTIANACASGANAVGHAWEVVRRGRAKRVLAGGYDALSQLVFAGFDALQALSPTVCRPFDARRDGLALGEGAAVLALEAWEDALARDAEILGDIVGYGATTDPHHLTQPHPQGDAALGSMNAACSLAGVTPAEIGYVNAHGTGTPLNDSAEAAAICRWADGHAGSVAVSSTKASVGHLLGAAGAVETVVCLMALRGQWLPPMPGLETPDAAAKFRLVRKPVAARFEYALSNSFGFGGANASLLLRGAS